MSMERPGIIVLGVPRSGTTLVRRLLGAHPNIACPPETNLLNAVSRFLEEHPFAGGMSLGVLSGLHFAGFDEETVLARTREFVGGFYRDIAARAGKPRWAEKTAADVFHLDQIERLFGDHCQYVCVLRHPLDVIVSMKELSDKMQAYMPELHAYVARYLSPYEGFAHAWADANLRMLRFCREHPEGTVLLRYEELVRDPKAEMTRVFQFLGEAGDAGALVDEALRDASEVGLGDWKTYQTQGISTASVGRRGALDPGLVARVAEFLNPVMVECGYEPIAVKGVLDGAAARRHYELSLRVSALRPAPSGPGTPRP